MGEKYIYAADTPTLALFLGKVRQEWNLDSDKCIERIVFSIQGIAVRVGPLEEKSWDFALGIAAGSNVVIAVFIAKSG